jgi:small subunit ribosomal protein S4e
MSKHLKRLAAPRTWTIARKTTTYTTKPSPGPHAIAHSVPLSTVLRDYLGLATTGREAKNVIGGGKILVDGRIVKNSKLPIGFMDVVSVPAMKKAWRVAIDDKARIRFVEVGEKEGTWKLAQIKNKTTVTGGKTQLNLHDGRCLLIKKDDYSTGDVLKLELPTQKIIGHFRFEEGAEVLVTGGRHAGEIAPVANIEVTRSHKPNLVHLKDGDNAFTTVKHYAFPIGDKTNVPKVEVSLLD